MEVGKEYKKLMFYYSFPNSKTSVLGSAYWGFVLTNREDSWSHMCYAWDPGLVPCIMLQTGYATASET